MSVPSFRTKRVHGEHKEVHIGEDFATDRFGVVTGTVERHIFELPDEPQWKYILPSSCPAIVPFPCVGVRRRYDKAAGMATYSYAVQGLEASDVGFEDRIFCGLDGSDTEEPIETHPDFEALYKKYKGRPEPGTSKFGYFEKVIELDGKKQFNPLYGVTHFLTVSLVWTRTFVARSLPQSILARVDTIDRPQGHGGMQPPPLKGKRNWLKVAPVAQQRGNCIQIAERWIASGKNGWNKDIYGQKHSAGTA